MPGIADFRLSIADCPLPIGPAEPRLIDTRESCHTTSSSGNQQSAISNRQSPMSNQQSTIDNRQSTIDNETRSS
jgi:hypothetical protein